MSGKYDDILHLPHPTSVKHPRMPISERAAIFSPFAALTGHGDAIRETARLTEQKIELDEDTKAELDRRQAVLLDNQIDGGGDLLSARVNDSGWLAVTAQQSGYKGAVTVYDSGHQPVIQISLSSTFVVDAAVSPDCKTVAVVTMDQEGGRFYSRLLLYPVDREEPSAQVDLGNIVCLDLDYESDQIWVMGEDELVIADPKGEEESRSYALGRYYLKGCDLEGDGFALLLLGQYRAGSATQALILDSQGQIVQSLALNSQVLDYSAAGNYWALLTGSDLTIRTSTGTEPYALLEDPQGARYADLSNDGSALLADAQQAWLYLPN